MIRPAKSVLKIGLLLYVILTALSLMQLLNIDALKQVLKLGDIYIPITTIILLAYAWDKGEEKIAKIGLLCIVLDIISTFLIRNNIVTISNKIPLYIVDVIRTLSSCGTSLCAMMALFGIIPNENSKGDLLKLLAIICLLVYTLIDLADVFISVYSYKWLSSLEVVFINASRILEYSFIVFYLLNKREDIVAEIKAENPLLQQTTITPSQTFEQPVVQQQSVIQQQPVMQPGQVAAVPPQPQQNYYQQ